MGKKLDSVKNKSSEGKETFNAGRELGTKAVSDTKQMKSLIDSLPTDVDDEIVQAAKAVEQGTKSDAEGYMQSEVNSKVEQGKRSMEASNQEANDQVRNNDQVMKTFQQMDGVGSFGRSARDSGRTSVEQSTQQFEQMIAENDRAAAEAEQEYQRELSDISSTF